MKYSFSILPVATTYSLSLRPRDYPTFEGRYNAYLSVYGQLSGEYLGDIEQPVRMDCTPDDIPEILNTIDWPSLIKRHNHQVSIW